MRDTVIEIENLSKLYRLGEYDMAVLREDIYRWWCRIRGQEDPFLHRGEYQGAAAKGEISYFWALKDINLEIKKGEILGIIGRNGAGKSTLLKILSRITVPTRGEIRVRGRIASLLEVGTGFNPELTGRENIYLNGTILGMRKREIDRKFDEIVDFSGVERHLETPVKRYSSGMYVRLAFAVAAHLEPEILIVDEVLAVGDAEFQKKCLGKMQSVSARDGRTVLFVSHNITAVETLCQTGVVLEAGRVICRSNIAEAVQAYSGSTKINNLNKYCQFGVDHSRPCISSLRIDADELLEGNLVVDIGFTSPVRLDPPVVGVVVSSLLGVRVFASNPLFHKHGYGSPKLSEGVLRMTANQLPVAAGAYRLTVWLGDQLSHYDEKRSVMEFEISAGHPEAETFNPEHIGFSESAATWTVLENI